MEAHRRATRDAEEDRLREKARIAAEERFKK